MTKPPIKHTIRLIVGIDTVLFMDALVEHPDPDVLTGKTKAKFVMPREMKKVSFQLDMSKPWSNVIGEIVHQMAMFYTEKEND